MNKLHGVIPANWEAELEKTLMKLQDDAHWQKDYFASPCNADTTEKIFQNMKAARLYLYYAVTYMNLNAIAPQAYLPTMLRDHESQERFLGIQFGIELLKRGASLHLCGSQLTDGMHEELIQAIKLDIPIFIYHEQLYEYVRKSAVLPGDWPLLIYNNMHPILGISSEKLNQLGVLYA